MLIDGNSAILVMGDSYSFTVHRSAYLASEWNGQFVLSLFGSKMTSKDAVADVENEPDDFLVQLTSEETASYKPGKCQAWMVFSNIAEAALRFTEDLGLVYVQPNPLGQLPPSENRKALKDITRAISRIVASPESSVSFNGQSYTVHNLRDLYEIRDRLQVAVDAELAEMGVPTKGSGFKNIRTRFV